MRIVKMGIDPDLALATKFNTWRALAKHRRCGTVVSLIISDVHFRYYPGGWDDDSYIVAWWTCPVCKRDNDVSISRWKLDNDLRDYWYSQTTKE